MRILKSFLYHMMTFASQGTNYYFALPQRNINIIHDALLNVSNIEHEQYGEYWTKESILQTIAPSYEFQSKVMNCLDNIGFTDIHTFGDAIRASHSQDVQLKVRDVCGEYYEVMERVKPNNNKRKNKPMSVDEGYAGKEVTDRLYGLSGKNVSGVSVGVIEFQDNGGVLLDDLATYQMLNGESTNNPKKLIRNHDEDTESSLDIQMISQTAPGADLWYWNNENWLYGFAVDFFHATEKPDVISMSWGWSETDQCSIVDCGNSTSAEYVNRTNVEFMKIALQGVTIVASSGDSGAPGRTNEYCDMTHPVNPVLPGGSPWVTSVGGTYLLSTNDDSATKTTPLCENYPCANGTVERVTSFKEVGWTAGGGFSSTKYMPFQKNAIQTYLSRVQQLPPLFHRHGRAYPDVSMIAHNCPTVEFGSVSPVDGTSCSSPLFAGLVAVLNYHQVQNGKPKLGYLNPLLYKMGEQNVFHDIAVGNNQCTESGCCNSSFGFMATKGFDPVTGWGTPNVQKMLAFLDAHT